jgi:hypothetical protein
LDEDEEKRQRGGVDRVADQQPIAFLVVRVPKSYVSGNQPRKHRTNPVRLESMFWNRDLSREKKSNQIEVFVNRCVQTQGICSRNTSNNQKSLSE